MKKTIIITGASGNMGQAVVKKFISAEFKVIGTIIPNDPVSLADNAHLEKVVVD